MAIKGITKIHLYCDASDESAAAKKFCDDNNIAYTLQWFADEKQHPEVFKPLGTWTFTNGKFDELVTKFPFVIYTEVHEGIDERKLPLAFINTDLSKSNLLELHNLGK